MADFSGLAITTLAVSFEIASTLYRYGRHVKGARKDIQSLSNELFCLIGVLEHVKAHQEHSLNEEDDDTLVDKSELSDSLQVSSDRKLSAADDALDTKLGQGSHESDASSVLRQTLEFLQELQKSLKEPKGRFAGAVHVLKWPLKEGEMKQHLQRLERVKTFFLLSLMMDEVDQSRKLAEEISSLRTLLEDTKLTHQLDKSRKDYLDFRQWLSPIDPREKAAAVSQVRTHGTGRWFLESAELREWADTKSSSGKTVWLNGITGAGKSTLMTSVVQWLLTPEDHGLDLAYFYCSFSDDRTLHTQNILSSLLAQTLSPSDLAYQEAKSMYDKSSAKTLGRAPLPDVQSLVKLIGLQAESRGQLFILIDGINECNDPDELLTSLKAIANTGNSVRLLLSGINEKGIDSCLSTFPVLYVETLRQQNVKADVFLYVESTLETHPRLRKLPSNLKDDIVYALTQGACGMFRWVRCQLENLARLRTPGAVRKALDSMPPTLDQTYEALLLRIDQGEDTELAKNILEFLTFSLRPLSLSEVCALLQITPGMTTLDESKFLASPMDILSICGSLLYYSEKTKSVALAHHSVKTYLTSTLPASVRNFQLDEMAAHRNITLSCLSYLSFHEFSTSLPFPADHNFGDLYPFFGYAATQWPLHINELSRTSEPDPTLWEILCAFLHGPNFRTWVSFLIPGSDYAGSTPPLYYAASYGMTTIVRYLLEMPGTDIEQRGGRGGATPINIASFRGHLDVVKMLLEKGADPLSPDLETGLNAVEWATYEMQWDVREYLLDNGFEFKDPEWVKDAKLVSVNGTRRLRKPDQ